MTLQELFSDSSKWCQDAEAHNSCGEPVLADNPEAVSFCLVGAVFYTYSLTKCASILQRIEDRLGESIATWNDAPERTFADIRQLIEEFDI